MYRKLKSARVSAKKMLNYDRILKVKMRRKVLEKLKLQSKGRDRLERKRKFNKDMLKRDEIKAMHEKLMELNNFGKKKSLFIKIKVSKYPKPKITAQIKGM